MRHRFVISRRGKLATWYLAGPTGPGGHPGSMGSPGITGTTGTKPTWPSIVLTATGPVGPDFKKI